MPRPAASATYDATDLGARRGHSSHWGAMGVKDTSLRRYWIEFEGSRLRGYGVTAIDLSDGLALIGRLPDGLRPSGAVANVVEDVDVQSLDAGHVLPNMGAPIWRGVWYPNVPSSNPDR